MTRNRTRRFSSARSSATGGEKTAYAMPSPDHVRGRCFNATPFEGLGAPRREHARLGQVGEVGDGAGDGRQRPRWAVDSGGVAREQELRIGMSSAMEERPNLG